MAEPTRAATWEDTPEDPNAVVVGQGELDDGSRVVVMRHGGRDFLMSPARARVVAQGFDDPLAKVAGLGWIGDALREYADRAEAATATKQ